MGPHLSYTSKDKKKDKKKPKTPKTKKTNATGTPMEMMLSIRELRTFRMRATYPHFFWERHWYPDALSTSLRSTTSIRGQKRWLAYTK